MLKKVSFNYNWQYFLYLSLYLDEPCIGIKNGSIMMKIKEQEFEIKFLYHLPLPPPKPGRFLLQSNVSHLISF